MLRFCKTLIPNFSEIEEKLDTDRISNFGPAYEELCLKLRDFLKVSDDKDIILTSSGHTALMAAYAAVQSKKLIVPAYTFESTRAAASIQGITTIVQDVDINKGYIDIPELLALPLSEYDSVALVCPLSAIPDLEEYHYWTKINNKHLVIDGAATFGTPGVYNWGTAYCLSFHATKTFSTGEGGALIIDKEFSSKAKSFINFGFDENRNVVQTGINGKISEYNCSIGLSLLNATTTQDALQRRLLNSQIYLESLSDLILTSSNEHTVYQSIPVYLDSKEKACSLRGKLTEEGIEFGQYYPPLDSISPNAKSLYDRNVCLPCHHGVTEKDINKIVDIIRTVI